MLRTIKIAYLTLLHAALFAMIFLYTNDRYALVRIDDAPKQEARAECCQGDELTAYLDKHIHKRR